MNHYLNGIALNSKVPNEYNEIIFGAGCFWGVERKFWQLDGVWLTSVRYFGNAMTQLKECDKVMIGGLNTDQ